MKRCGDFGLTNATLAGATRFDSVTFRLTSVSRLRSGEYVYTLVSLEEGAVAEPIGAGRLAPSSSESGVGHSAVTSSAGDISPRDGVGDGELVRCSRFEPLGGAKANDRSGEKPSGEPDRASHGDAAKQAFAPPSGEQLTVWESAA